MANETSDKKSGFWQSMPGIITAIAGLLTASVGAYTAYNNIKEKNKPVAVVMDSTKHIALANLDPAPKPQPVQEPIINSDPQPVKNTIDISGRWKFENESVGSVIINENEFGFNYSEFNEEGSVCGEGFGKRTGKNIYLEGYTMVNGLQYPLYANLKLNNNNTEMLGTIIYTSTGNSANVIFYKR